eukprot:12063-Eustigmatos_ZCMA.PRE.1
MSSGGHTVNRHRCYPACVIYFTCAGACAGDTTDGDAVERALRTAGSVAILLRSTEARAAPENTGRPCGVGTKWGGVTCLEDSRKDALYGVTA